MFTMTGVTSNKELSEVTPSSDLGSQVQQQVTKTLREMLGIPPESSDKVCENMFTAGNVELVTHSMISCQRLS